ncbi:hypothetical protein RFM98_10715 [Mesorhizobium sp. VK9D]|uniref:hypothetical protein n=1 Tax=Mesorhizobium australafricanum TaxID=3072311 RepID=UPI002A247006|nr:hypothetical protein [Mesorhizobium sp. VK9D]MDX8453230.1 hypothetical protein [Mesorhizobium sp. VK9D]
MTVKINILAVKSSQIGPKGNQPNLPLVVEKEREIDGVVMGVLSDGTPYLNQRGLAALCDVQNAHIGTISSQWNDVDQKPRIQRIKAILEKVGKIPATAHIEVLHRGVVHYCYPADVSLAIMEYYAIDAGVNVSEKARDNYRILAGSRLRDMIYSQVGYDPRRGKDRFAKWHERLALNYQSAPKGHFHVFNETHTIIYELIVAGANIGEKFVVDISIGQHWSKYWDDHNLSEIHGVRRKYPHRYPDDHPQSKANPHESWCYPLAALGAYREWLQDEYLEGGKFKGYLAGKVAKGDLPPSFAQLAISALAPGQIAGPGANVT